MNRRNTLTENVEEPEPDMNHEAGSVPLTEREDTQLRGECLHDGEAVSWDSATDMFRYVQNVSENDSALLETNTQTSEIPYSVGADYTELERIEQVYQGFRNEHRITYLYEITQSGVPFGSDGYLPIADFLNDMEESWSAVQQKLYDRLSGEDYWYCRVWDSTESGYPCLRLLLSTTTEISDGGESLLEAHVANSPVASDIMHDPNRHVRSDRSVKVHEAVEERLSCFGDSRAESWQSDAFHAALWATERDRFNYSSSAEEYMR